MIELIERTKQLCAAHGIGESAARVLVIAAAAHYHSTPLVSDQRDDILFERIVKWVEKSEGETTT